MGAINTRIYLLIVVYMVFLLFTLKHLKIINPKQEQFKKVINIFKKVYSSNKEIARVDMIETKINYCRSPMYHAGWYAVAKKLNEDINGFEEGAHLIAKDLGFTSEYMLRLWADRNPHIWGNREGFRMFQSSRAFSGETTITGLKQIIDHWEGVKRRAKQYNIEEQKKH